MIVYMNTSTFRNVNHQNNSNQMERQQNQEDLSLVKPQPHLSTFGVLKEAIKTTRRNGKLAVSILLLAFLSFSQLELGSHLALEPILQDLSSYWPVSQKVISFENRPAGRSSPWAERNSRSYQRPYPSSYSGYTGQTVKSREQKGAYSSYRTYPSTYSGYTGQPMRRSEHKGGYSSYRTYPASHGGNMGWTMQANEHNSAYSYQRSNPSSYGYMGQPLTKSDRKGAYSYHQANPSSYGYKDQAMPKGALKDVRAIVGLKLLILSISCVLLLFFLVAAVSSSYEAYTAKVMSLKDVFLTFRESWKRPIHTGFCLTLITSGLLGLFAIFIVLFLIFTKGSSEYILYTILIFSGSVVYFHLAALWMVSLVVSVLESESSGLKAIVRAGELMKGKRRQAYVLILLFNLANGAVNAISSAYTRKLDKWSKMGITIPFTIGLICVFKLLMFVTFTVYYHERKMNQKEEKVEGRLGLYVSTASDEA